MKNLSKLSFKQYSTNFERHGTKIAICIDLQHYNHMEFSASIFSVLKEIY